MSKTRVAKICVANAGFSFDRPFDYIIPEPMTDSVMVGKRVVVPFGRANRKSEGMVLKITDMSDFGKLKTVNAVLDERPVLSENDIRLAVWMSERFFCTVYEAIKAMLPAGVWYSSGEAYCLNAEYSEQDAYDAGGEDARTIYKIIKASKTSTSIEAIRQAYDGESEPLAVVKKLVKMEILLTNMIVSTKVKDKMASIISLAVSNEEAAEIAVRKSKASPLQRAVIDFLLSAGPTELSEISYYTGASRGTIKSMEKNNIISVGKVEVFRKPKINTIVNPGEIVLNSGQEAAYDGIKALLGQDKPSAVLLHGVTGSGKTQVYIKLIKSCIAIGRTAIVLVPEIALTPQLMSIFASHFGERVAVLHSSLTLGERYDEWKRIRDGLCDVVVGTRSAVFAPINNIGIIILDEEQETTYKSENSPRYHARDIAKYRCVQNNAVILLGSATPSIESAYNAKQGIYKYYQLTERYNKMDLPAVKIADMREELANGNGGTISSVLRNELAKNINSGRQSILFINRRGNARLITCGECGFVPYCERCSVALTFHSANGRMMCHYCGYSQKLDEYCPECSGRMKYMGEGTQKVEEELYSLFPGIKALRMDTDTVTAANTHESILSAFRDKNIPVLIGTQMVAKGLDFENVTLVGVIAADNSLFIDDFRANERTFSLITQVVGRAGRGGNTGRAVIQTILPGNPVIVNAANQDYESFYAAEIEMRYLNGLPPFSDVIRITLFGGDETMLLRSAMRIKNRLDELLEAFPRNEQYTLLGPAPAPIVKVNNQFRYHLVLRCRADKPIRSIIAQIIREFKNDKQNKGISAFADLNPL